MVLADDGELFTNHYGIAPFDTYSGNLSANGERLELRGWYDVIIDSLTYGVDNPWDEFPVDHPSSLELLDAKLDNANPISWFGSEDTCGTPGKSNTRDCNNATRQIVINEINYNSNNEVFDPGDWIELYNPNNFVVDLSNWIIYDNGSEFELPSGTTLRAGGYLVLVEEAAVFKAAFPNVDNLSLIHI